MTRVIVMMPHLHLHCLLSAHNCISTKAQNTAQTNSGRVCSYHT
jgi:hypothetical protein